MFAEDRGWLGRIREAIESGLTAEASVQKVRDDTRGALSRSPIPISAKGWRIWRIWPTGCSIICRAKRRRRRPRPCPRMSC
ncbi:MAG: hypothetical protein WDN69_15210 [Aliidongia sp.]